MKVWRIILRVAVLGSVIAAFFGVPHAWLSVKAQGLFWGAAATLLLGRFFCDAICPLGILQSAVNRLFHPKSAVRRVCTRLPETRVQRVVRWGIVAALVGLGATGFMGLVTVFLPISIVGKAIGAAKTLATGGCLAPVFAVVSFGVLALVLVLAAIGKGRIWCNWICPFGTVYALLARVCFVKNTVGSGCGGCRKCFENQQGAAKAGELSDGVSRRETLKGVAMLAVADKLTDGGYAPVSEPGVPERGLPVLPPGAGSARAFTLKCVACQLCVANCPGGCLRPSVSLIRFGQPEMDFRKGPCIASCVKCGEVCPEGAIEKLTSAMRKNVHIGHAEWKKDLCIRTTEKVSCDACVRKCPVRAIHLVGGFPVVDREVCIGCGACEHVCPARPQPAIFVKGHAEQRTVRPMGESDLLAEMKALVDAGKACVVARGGVIVRQLEGRGVRPIVEELDRDPKAFAGALVYDKVVGRAAAAVYVVGHASKVAADVMSEGAVAFLESHGIAAQPGRKVPAIINREKTGECPMELAVKKLDKPEEMVEQLRKAIRK